MTAGCEPLSDAEFETELGRFAPFEDRPALAIAVSGGADSTALALLSAEWARRRGGSVTALIVDHGLRRESAAEARTVAERLTAADIAPVILSTDGDPTPVRRNQASAREFRYGRLLSWCRAHGVLHLLTGHHRHDQAETVLMRLLHGSGLDGLAGIDPCREFLDVRVLRPLLRVDPARLRALLRGRGIPWLEDPSNAATTYERNRLRRQLPQLAAAGLSTSALLQLADDAARARAGTAEHLAALIAGSCRLSPFGHAIIEPDVLAASGPDLAAMVLSRVLATVGGRPWPCGITPCARLIAGLNEGRRGRVGTLGGCVVARTAAAILVYRERRNLPAAMPVAQRCGPCAEPPVGQVVGYVPLWDGRFTVHWACRYGDALPEMPLQVRPLGNDEALRCTSRGTARGASMGITREPVGSEPPPAVLATMPAVFAGNDLIAGPFGGPVADARRFGLTRFEVIFHPRRSLSGHGYFLSGGNSVII